MDQTRILLLSGIGCVVVIAIILVIWISVSNNKQVQNNNLEKAIAWAKAQRDKPVPESELDKEHWNSCPAGANCGILPYYYCTGLSWWWTPEKTLWGVKNINQSAIGGSATAPRAFRNTGDCIQAAQYIKSSEKFGGNLPGQWAVACADMRKAFCTNDWKRAFFQQEGVPGALTGKPIMPIGNVVTTVDERIGDQTNTFYMPLSSQNLSQWCTKDTLAFLSAIVQDVVQLVAKAASSLPFVGELTSIDTNWANQLNGLIQDVFNLWKPSKESVLDCFNSFIDGSPSIGAHQGYKYSKSIGSANGGLNLKDFRSLLHDAILDTTKITNTSYEKLTADGLKKAINVMCKGNVPANWTSMLAHLTDCAAGQLCNYLLGPGPSDPAKGASHFQQVQNAATLLSEGPVSQSSSQAVGKMLAHLFNFPKNCGQAP